MSDTKEKILKELKLCELRPEWKGDLKKTPTDLILELAIHYREALEKAAKALDEAAEDIENWGAYASEYFQEKWDLRADIERVQADAREARTALEGK